jgi:hypothetical protein
MTKRPEPNRHVMLLNLFQHLVGYFLPFADASFIPAHRTEFSDALLIIINNTYDFLSLILFDLFFLGTCRAEAIWIYSKACHENEKKDINR